MNTIGGHFHPFEASLTGHSTVAASSVQTTNVSTLLRAAGLLMYVQNDRHAGGENTPFHIAPSGSACAWDGTLHNRDDLAAEFRIDQRKHSDASLALAAYERFQLAGLYRLIGDWSLALWDAGRRRLVLASDYAGVRPLYYRVSGKEFAWASELKGLAACGNSDLDDQYFAEFLLRGAVKDRTPYCGVYSVPPGHAILIDAAGAKIERFYDLPNQRFTGERNDVEYEEEFRHLFVEAVRVRLQGASGVFAELSGGLDSSSIVCASHKVLHDHAGPLKQVRTISYDEDGSPDKQFISIVEQHCKLPNIHLSLSKYPSVDLERVGEETPAWWQPRLEAVADCMKQTQSTAFLTGQFGDLITGNFAADYEQISDLLVQRRYGRVLPEAAAWSNALRVPIYSVLKSAVHGMSPKTRPVLLSRLDSRSVDDSLTPWARNRLSEVLSRQDKRDHLRGVEPSLRKRLILLTEILESRTLQCPGSMRGLSVTHPFTHRPLVEFLLRVPAAVICRPGESRRLMRRALRDLLPPAVLNRRSKGTYGSAFNRAIMPLARDLRDNLATAELVKRGLVDLHSLAFRLGRFLNGLDCNAPQLRNLILIERWLTRTQRQHCRTAAVAASVEAHHST